MQTHNLTRKQLIILQTLARGEGYEKAALRLQPAVLSRANYHVTCYQLREKTGIRNTRDSAECKAYLERLYNGDVRDPRRLAKQPTKRQLEIMGRFARGMSHSEIATELGIVPQTSMDVMSAGCRRLGIKACGMGKRLVIADALATLTPPPDPMDDPAF